MFFERDKRPYAKRRCLMFALGGRKTGTTKNFGIFSLLHDLKSQQEGKCPSFSIPNHPMRSK
jgi:hypothetical protein